MAIQLPWMEIETVLFIKVIKLNKLKCKPRLFIYLFKILLRGKLVYSFIGFNVFQKHIII